MYFFKCCCETGMKTSGGNAAGDSDQGSHLNAMAACKLLDGGGGVSLPDSLRWNPFACILDRDAVAAVHKSYIEAGATIIETNSYCCTPRNIHRIVALARKPPEKRRSIAKHCGCSTTKNDMDPYLDKIRDFSSGKTISNLCVILIKEYVNIARQSATSGVKVAGVIPPLGDSYDPIFPRDSSVLYDDYNTIIKALSEERVDIFLIETLSCIEVGEVILNMIPKTILHVWVSIVPCEGAIMLDGTPLSEVFDTFRSAELILANCGSIKATTEFVEFAKSTNKKFGVYSNNTEDDQNTSHELFGWNDIMQCWYGESEEEEDVESENSGDSSSGHATSIKTGDASTSTDESTDAYDLYDTAVREWVASGASVVGGCCGVCPVGIKRCAVILKSL